MSEHDALPPSPEHTDSSLRYEEFFRKIAQTSFGPVDPTSDRPYVEIVDNYRLAAGDRVLQIKQGTAFVLNKIITASDKELSRDYFADGWRGRHTNIMRTVGGLASFINDGLGHNYLTTRGKPFVLHIDPELMVYDRRPPEEVWVPQVWKDVFKKFIVPPLPPIPGYEHAIRLPRHTIAIVEDDTIEIAGKKVVLDPTQRAFLSVLFFSPARTTNAAQLTKLGLTYTEMLPRRTQLAKFEQAINQQCDAPLISRDRQGTLELDQRVDIIDKRQNPPEIPLKLYEDFRKQYHKTLPATSAHLRHRALIFMLRSFGPIPAIKDRVRETIHERFAGWAQRFEHVLPIVVPAHHQALATILDIGVKNALRAGTRIQDRYLTMPQERAIGEALAAYTVLKNTYAPLARDILKKAGHDEAHTGHFLDQAIVSLDPVQPTSLPNLLKTRVRYYNPPQRRTAAATNTFMSEHYGINPTDAVHVIDSSDALTDAERMVLSLRFGVVLRRAPADITIRKTTVTYDAVQEQVLRNGAHSLITAGVVLGRSESWVRKAELSAMAKLTTSATSD